MLRILSHRHWDAGSGYDALVLADTKKVWIRLERAGDGTLLRFWSRDANGTTEDDVEAVLERLRGALHRAAATGAADHDALTIWPQGWELWIGTPVPIADELLAPAFSERLARSHAGTS